MSWNTEKNVICWGNAMFASKANINIFWNSFEWRVPEGDPYWRIFFKKTLILVFEVIVQPPKHTYEIGFFSCVNISIFTKNVFISQLCM